MPADQKRPEASPTDNKCSESSDAAREHYLTELDFLEKRLCWQMSRKHSETGSRRS